MNLAVGKTSRWGLWTVVLALLAASVSALTLTNATPAHAAYPGPQPGMNCDKPWVILSAYGTAEYTDGNHPYGSAEVNDTYIQALLNTLGSAPYNVPSSDVTIRNLPYPASALGWFPSSLGGPDDYWTSMNAGRDELVREIGYYAACPNRPTLILVGYSQGGQVVKNAIAQPAVRGDQRNSDEIGAIVTVGDASRYNGQTGLAQSGNMLTIDADYNVVSPDVNRGGVMQRLAVPSVFAGFLGDGRYFDVCRTGNALTRDSVCDEDAAPGSTPWEQKWLTDFVNSIGGLGAITACRNAPHTQYRKYNCDGSVNSGAAAIADRVADRAVAAAARQRDVLHPPPSPPSPSGTPEQVWATDVHVRTAPSTQSAIVSTIPSPTTVYVSCQEHAEPVTAGGVTNDVWSYLPAQHGWISNVFLKGPAWLPGVDECAGAPSPAPPSGLYKCSIGGNPNDWCAHVTAIDSGSYLALQNAPDYEHGHSPYYQGHNGDQLIVYCWTTGADDADGTGDHYWFSVDDGANFSGYVNDRYLTTGTYAQWSKIISHC